MDKHNYPFDTDIIGSVITKKYAKALIYKFLRRRGLHYAFVEEVRNFTQKNLSIDEVLDRALSNGRTLGYVLVDYRSTFPWVGRNTKWHSIGLEWNGMTKDIKVI